MRVRSLLAAVFTFSLSLTAFAQQQVTFDHQSHAAPSIINTQISVDLNNDRATDIVTDGPSTGINVLLSNGDGSFQTPVAYPIGFTVRDIAAGDVDGDGNADVVVAAFDNVNGAFKGIGVLYGKGDGTLAPPVFYASTDIIPDRIVIADFTGNGRKDILITGGHSGDRNYYARLYTNTGGRNFTFGGGIKISDTDSCCDFTSVAVGDFDGDGHADFFVQRNDQASAANTLISLFVVYGNGDGTFTSGPSQTFNGNVLFTSTDLNQDGKSDIVGILTVADSSGHYTSNVLSFFGNLGRQLTATTLLSFPSSAFGMQAADFNGDGNVDLAFTGGFVLQRADGTFARQQTDLPAFPKLLGDFNHDAKPDLGMVSFPPNPKLETLINTTAGDFSNFCDVPANGIHACLPTDGSSVSSPVAFKLAAATFTPLRKIELWIDGKKAKESFYAYFDYAFLNASLDLPAGAHHADIYATGYDNTLQHQSLSFTVGTTPPPPPPANKDFTIAVSPTSATVRAGQAASYSVNVTAQNSFTGPVTLACSGLPTGAACVFNPNPLNVTGASGTATLQITTTGATASLMAPHLTSPSGRSLVALFASGSVGVFGLCFAIGNVRRDKKRGFVPLAMLMIMLVLVLMLAGCGGGKSIASPTPAPPPANLTPAGTYTVTVTGTSGSLQHTTIVQLVVQ